jgi:hypothetical protein
MVKTKLVEALIEDGAQLLHQLDRRHFPVEAMAWVHFTDEGYWRLLIASPKVGEPGGTVDYRRLNEVLREAELAGTTLADTSLVNLASPQFKSRFGEATASSRLAPGSEWLEFEDAIVYRWNSASLSGELTCDISAKELTQLWDADRKIVNNPALLIATDGRRVTLRFHPQHGGLTGIENVKQAFVMALHRPDCQVNWLDS